MYHHLSHTSTTVLFAKGKEGYERKREGERDARELSHALNQPFFFLSLSHTNIHPCFNYDKQMTHLGIAENTDSLTLHSLTRPTARHTQPSTQLLLNKVDIKELENATGRRCQEEGVHYNKDVFCTHLKG